MSTDAIIEHARELQHLLTTPSADGRTEVAALTLVGKIKRLADGIGVELAGTVATLSEPTLDRPLCKALAEKSPAAVVQAYAGVDVIEASAWCRTGSALRREVTLLGETLPPRHPALAAALAEGAVRPSHVARVLEVVEQIEPYSSLDERAEAEGFLIETAPLVSDRGFARLCGEVVLRFLPQRAEELEERARRRRGVLFRTTRDGRRQLVADIDPETEGFARAALDAQTSPRREIGFVDSAALDGDDTRSLAQRRFDALAAIFRSSLGADTGRVAGTSVTMHVTVSLDALISGIGTAKIAGVDQPISASTARRLAAGAEIIPCVLGSENDPLDMGRSVRLATEGQRAALSIRDGGCIWPLCDAPPGWCEVAHIVAWMNGGATDVDNLMLLCPFHHRCFDNDGWDLTTIDGERYLIPPAWVDSARSPRRAGNPRALAA